MKRPKKTKKTHARAWSAPRELTRCGKSANDPTRSVMADGEIVTCEVCLMELQMVAGHAPHDAAEYRFAKRTMAFVWDIQETMN